MPLYIPPFLPNSKAVRLTHSAVSKVSDPSKVLGGSAENFFENVLDRSFSKFRNKCSGIGPINGKNGHKYSVGTTYIDYNRGEATLEYLPTKSGTGAGKYINRGKVIGVHVGFDGGNLASYHEIKNGQDCIVDELYFNDAHPDKNLRGNSYIVTRELKTGKVVELWQYENGQGCYLPTSQLEELTASNKALQLKD